MEAARETKILITSTSTVSFEDAIREGVSRAVSALRNVQGVSVKDMNVVIEGGNIAGYRVNMEATFVLVDDETGPIDQLEDLPIETDPVPLRAGEEGTVRVGGTRVTLDSVVAAFREGETAEGIKQRYPTLNLDDVYLVIGWYLRHRNRVDAYLARREGEAARLREEIEVYFDPAGVRDRLLARRGAPPRAPGSQPNGR
jgi:flavin-binding protein dodecin/uncharacterized protein (DUF433 family)